MKKCTGCSCEPLILGLTPQSLNVLKRKAEHSWSISVCQPQRIQKVTISRPHIQQVLSIKWQGKHVLDSDTSWFLMLFLAWLDHKQYAITYLQLGLQTQTTEVDRLLLLQFLYTFLAFPPVRSFDASQDLSKTVLSSPFEFLYPNTFYSPSLPHIILGKFPTALNCTNTN